MLQATPIAVSSWHNWSELLFSPSANCTTACFSPQAVDKYKDRAKSMSQTQLRGREWKRENWLLSPCKHFHGYHWRTKRETRIKIRYISVVFQSFLFFWSQVRSGTSCTSCLPTVYLPFGRDVFLLLCKRSKAVIAQESLPMTPHEALDALAPPARVSVAAALEHQGSAETDSNNRHGDFTGLKHVHAKEMRQFLALTCLAAAD